MEGDKIVLELGWIAPEQINNVFARAQHFHHRVREILPSTHTLQRKREEKTKIKYADWLRLSQRCKLKCQRGALSFIRGERQVNAYPFFWCELASPLRTVSAVFNISTPCLLQPSRLPCWGAFIFTFGSSWSNENELSFSF